MTKTKLKKNGINITIENNLFSKNKSTEKKEQDDDIEEDTGLPPSYTPPNPFEAEPAFLGEIRNHMAEKRFYNMRINPIRPSYTDMNMVHQNFLNEKENVVSQSSYNQESELPSLGIQNDDTLSQFDTAPQKDTSIYFDQSGNYVNKNENDTFKKIKERTRNDYLSYKKKPQRKSLKKYGLPDDFLDDWEQKKMRYEQGDR